MSKENVLKVENVTMQFGGVIAVDNLNLEVNRGDRLPDRTERGGQDHSLQRDYGRIRPHQRSGLL